MIHEERDIDAALSALRDEPELVPASDLQTRLLSRLERSAVLSPSAEGSATPDASGAAVGAAAPVANVTAIALAFSLGAVAGVGAMALLRAPNERVVYLPARAPEARPTHSASVVVVGAEQSAERATVASSSAGPAVLPRPVVSLQPSPVLPSPGRTPVERASGDQQELLDRARVELNAGDGARALSSIEQHVRRFPTTWLDEERQALRIRALHSVGRRTEARRAYMAFATRFPHSPLLSSLGALFHEESVTEAEGGKQ